jgi:hypothetical protein
MKSKIYHTVRTEDTRGEIDTLSYDWSLFWGGSGT